MRHPPILTQGHHAPPSGGPSRTCRPPPGGPPGPGAPLPMWAPELTTRTTPRTDAQMRRLPLTPIATLALTAALTPALVVLPTRARPAAPARPVAPHVVTLDLAANDPAGPNVTAPGTFAL